MSYPDYAKTKHVIPYSFIIQSGSNHLYYFGERHSFDPSNPQWDECKKFFNDFLLKTEGQKRIVIVEGGVREPKETESESVVSDGGMGLLAYHAKREHIPIHSSEPDERYERNELTKHFSKEAIQYYYFARVVHQWGRKLDPKPNFEEYVGRFLERDMRVCDWPGFDFSLEAMKKIHEDMFKTAFDMNDRDFFYSVITPVELNTVVNEVSRASSEIRDMYIVDEIKRHIDEGYSVFAEYGGTHAVMQEPLLREILG